MTVLLVLASVIFLGVILLVLSIILRKRIAIPDGEVTYSDSERKPGEVMEAKGIPLVGKPDYIIKKDDNFIPVEVKTGSTPSSPYKNHIAQLYAYCLLVAEHFEKRPPYGIISYPEQEIPLEYTNEAETGVKKIVTEVMDKKRTGTYRKDMKQVCKKCLGGNHK